MAKTINRIGFGQVEPNHLSGQRTGQIYAQLPAAADIKVLENGQFAKYDYANKEVNFTGAGEWMLVFNEVKIYDPRESYKDFALQTVNYTDGEMTPRLLKTNVGDHFTTNAFYKAGTKGAALLTNEEVEGATFDIEEGDLLKVDTNGFFIKGGDVDADPMVWQAAKIYTMPDGQAGVKVIRIK